MPPYGSRSFHFDIHNFRNITALGVQAPTKSMPPYGETWICHCLHYWTSYWGPGRKSPLPPVVEQGQLLRLDLSISCNFQQLWFSWQKCHPTWMEQGKILTLDLSISCNFQQHWFNWQNPQGPNREKFWDCIYPFMQFSATLVQLAEKPSPQGLNREKFWDYIYPFHAISSSLVQPGRKASPKDTDLFPYEEYYLMRSTTQNERHLPGTIPPSLRRHAPFKLE